ncbi:predicted protein [Naegleria gruberi]|uniref:Predicted protein n=1 Tax=Naegleria gruberi TaxID=5762 RepID=D2VZI2_NAEGR|nr:uncharacterized protein NAEGRDRAFT_74497 [Naegleria gruberi]EFC37796.1 predicted protein [Naegleria gruberi]|eukprot:XP_002670540.1 predicted protein [Naegleria gruberi strain NEG-M]
MFEESETFDMNLSNCSQCQNGICRLSQSSIDGSTHCECSGLFEGEFCQECKDGFVKLSDKCVCPNGYQQIGFGCVFVSSSNATSCFGYSVKEGDRACSYHGICNLNTHLCECSENFDGDRCSTCKTGYTGSKCDIPICHDVSAIDSTVCNSKGDCVAPDSCQCNANYYGPNCASFKCNGIEKNNALVCSSHGTCSNADVCTCSSNYDSSTFCSKCLPSYNGTDCSIKICSPETTCRGHGQCNDQLQCICNGKFTGTYCEKCLDGWVGSNCDITCSAQTTCSGKGSCSSTGSCICSATSYGDHCENCKDGWYGANCDFRIDFTSFEFNENGDSISASVNSVMKKNINCSSLIVNTEVLGQGATCVLDGDKSLLIINLGTLATIVINGNLIIRNYIDSKLTTNAKVSGTFYQRVDPVASLTSEKSVIGCGTMFLDASSSTSLDRRRLLFTFSAVTAPNNQALSNLNNLISGNSASTVKFSVNNFTGGSYSVQVAVQSTFSGRVSYATFAFMVTDASPPNLSIKNGVSSTVTIGNSFVVTPIVSFPSCYSGSALISNLKFTYTQVSGAALQIKQKNELLVFSSDYTKLTEEGKYVFSLSAVEQGYPGASITFEIIAVALPLKVSFNIRDMSQSMEDKISFTVLKQDPSNPDDASGQVALSCVNMETLQSCDGFVQNGANIDQTTLLFNQKYGPGVYLFTAVYTKGSRFSSSKVKITVTSQSKSSFLRIYINTPSNIDLTSVDPSTYLILQAQSIDSLSVQRIYSWTTDFDSSSTSSLDLNKKYLSIPKSLLVPGASYTVSVKVVDGAKVGEGVISFVVNSPPTLGSLEINPSTGVALTDEFKVSCGNGWSDVQLPLTFKFLYRLQGDVFWKVLKERSETRSFSTVMPSGHIEIKSIVYDALGAATETTQIIQVTNPVDITSAVQSLNAISTSSVTSSSTSSALSVIQSLKPQTQEEKQKLSETGSKIAIAYFSQIEKEETVTSQTVSSTASSISVISSISTCISNLPESTVSFIITKFKSTVDGANSKLNLPDEDIESSFNSATTIQSYVVKNGEKRAIYVFSKVDITMLDQIKETLVNLQVKNLVADMPAARTFGTDYYSYMRLMSVSSLSNLNDTISSESSFSLSQPFSTLSQFSNLDTVKLVMKVQQQNESVTKLFSFKVVSTNTEIPISSDSIAELTIENNDGVVQNAATYECKILQNGQLTSLSSCVIVSHSATSFTVRVPSTGSYAIVANVKKDVIVDILSEDNLKYLAFLSLIVPIVVLIVIVFIVVVCVIRKRKRAKVQGV